MTMKHMTPDAFFEESRQWPLVKSCGKSERLEWAAAVMFNLGNMLMTFGDAQKFRVTIECDPDGQFTITREVFSDKPSDPDL